MIRYQNVKYEKKTNDSILRTFSDGWTDAQTTDRQTDGRTENETDFIRRCLTDAEYPAYLWKNFCGVKRPLFEQHLI